MLSCEVIRRSHRLARMRVCGRSTDDGRDDMLAQYEAAVSVRGTVLVAPDVLWSPLGTRTRRRGRPHTVLSSRLPPLKSPRLKTPLRVRWKLTSRYDSCFSYSPSGGSSLTPRLQPDTLSDPDIHAVYTPLKYVAHPLAGSFPSTFRAHAATVTPGTTLTSPMLVQPPTSACLRP